MPRFKLKDTSKRERIRIGDVFLVKNLEYGQMVGCKSRPIIVVGIKGNDVTYLKCTTKNHNYRNPVRIMDTQCAGLLQETYVDMERHTIQKNRLSCRMGTLSEHDLTSIIR